MSEGSCLGDRGKLEQRLVINNGQVLLTINDAVDDCVINSQVTVTSRDLNHKCSLRKEWHEVWTRGVWHEVWTRGVWHEVWTRGCGMRSGHEGCGMRSGHEGCGMRSGHEGVA